MERRNRIRRRKHAQRERFSVEKQVFFADGEVKTGTQTFWTKSYSKLHPRFEVRLDFLLTPLSSAGLNLFARTFDYLMSRQQSRFPFLGHFLHNAIEIERSWSFPRLTTIPI
jgi:hypothetical protein